MPQRLRHSLIALFVLAGLAAWTIQPVLAAEPVLTGLVLAPGVVTLTSDQTTVFTLTGTYSNATTANVTELAAWTVNGGGFTGIPGQKGSFTANAFGSWTVTAAIGGLSASATVTITHGAPTGLTLMPTPASVTTDGSVALLLYATDADGNGWDVTSVATWTTTETTGLISAAGYKPLAAGSWSLTGTLGVLTVTRAIAVTAGVVQTLSIAPAAVLTVKVGETAQLQATAYDADGNLLTPSVTWSLTNPAVGSVSTDGVFTAIGAGQTNIIATAGGTQSITPIIVQSASVVGSDNDPQIVAVAKPSTVARTPRVAAEEVERVPEVTTQTPEPTATTTATKAKTNFPHPWIIALILVHVILLAGYFAWLMRRTNSWWWVPPVVTSGIFLALYNTAFTKGTYLWWPWTIIGLTIIFISVYYQRYGPQEASPGSMMSPPKNPPQ